MNLDNKTLGKIESKLNNLNARTKNWNLICNEIDKIGICINNETKQAYIEGEFSEIHKIFNRIERFMKILTGND